MTKNGGWYEVKVVREGLYGTKCDGWIALSDSGVAFFWARSMRNEATPLACRFVCFRTAEEVIDEFLASRGAMGRFFEIHFPVRRDARGRKRPLLKGDCEIVKSA